MRIRTRMIITILLVGLIPLILAIVIALQVSSNLTTGVRGNLASINETIRVTPPDELSPLRITSFIANLTRSNDSTGRTAQAVIIIAGSVLIISTIGLGIFAATRLATPYEGMAESAQRSLRIMESMYPEIPSPPGRDEITSASHTLGLMETRIRDEYIKLERQVQDLTGDLHKRMNQLKDTARIVRETGDILDLDRFLEETATLIARRFGYYHTGIYLLDSTGETLSLMATDPSPGSRQMLAADKSIRIGPDSIAGFVIQSGEPYIAINAETDPHYQKSDYLPQTWSEIGLPIMSHGNVIGVLDLQSTTAGQFTDDDQAILQVIADQIALTIENTRLFQENQAVLDTTRRLLGEGVTRAWRELVEQKSNIGYIKTAREGRVVDDQWDPEIKVAFSNNRSTLSGDGAGLIIPILIRGEAIGVIRLTKPDHATWTEEEISLAETLRDQLTDALDSARLFDETRRRAEREQAISQVTAAIGASSDIEAILEATAREIGKLLGDSDVVIQIGQEIGESR
ncbi:MAG: GAF domain-containing protein [Chloroflexota bacterium]